MLSAQSFVLLQIIRAALKFSNFLIFFIFIKLQLFYSINSVIELLLHLRPVNKLIDELIYAMGNITFHGIEMCSIVLIADAITKEVSE